MLPMQLFLIVFLQISIINSSRNEAIFEFSNLIRSNSRNYFASDAEYISAHDMLFLEIQKDANTTHPFILSLYQDCIDCHNSLMVSVLADKYRIITAHKAIFFSSVEDIELLIKNNAHTIEHYIPLIHLSKIDNTIFSISTDETSKLKAADVEKDTRLIAIIAPMPNEELESFVEEIKVLTEDKLAPFIFDFTSLVSLTERAVYVTIADRANVIEVATKLSKRREILWIEYSHEIIANNKWAKGICQSGDYSETSMYSADITGEGQIFGVADTGIDMQSCYFIDPDVAVPYDVVDENHRKVITYISYQDKIDDYDGGHGSHVSSSLAGKCYKDSGEYKAYNGVAYDAKIAFFDIGIAGSNSLNPPSNLETGLFDKLYSAGARIFSNSWGAPSDNSYNYLSVSVDRFMWNNPEALVLFAAGNDGPYTSSIDSPSTNKNGIAVGASLNDYTSWALYYGDSDSSNSDKFGSNSMAYFSSIGPTFDGRQKPDVMAPGWWITGASSTQPPGDGTMYDSTAESHCTLKGMRGTSMSTPIVSGNAALIREYFMKGYYPNGEKSTEDSFVPSGALLKAMLIHSAEPLTYSVSRSSGYNVATSISSETIPNSQQGFGRIQLSNIIQIGQQSTGSARSPLKLFVVGSAEKSSSHYRALKRDETAEYMIYTTSENTQPSIKITLAYTDYPGTSGSSQPLINDLDVVVVDASGKVLHTSSGETGLNNVEVITIESPLPNMTYTVQVFCANSMPYSPQPYALVMTGEITQFYYKKPILTKIKQLVIYTINFVNKLPTFVIVISLGVLLLVFTLLSLTCRYWLYEGKVRRYVRNRDSRH